MTAVLHLIVSQSHTDGAVSIAYRSRDRTVVSIFVTRCLPHLLSAVVERVSYTKLEAREVGGIVANGVIHTVGVDGAERLTTISQAKTTTEGINHAQHVIGTNAVLTAKAQ